MDPIDTVLMNYSKSDSFMNDPEVDNLLCGFIYSKMNPNGSIGDLIHTIFLKYREVGEVQPALIKSLSVALDNGYSVGSVLRMIPHKYVRYYLYAI